MSRTDRITIGRDPMLTYAVLNGIRQRAIRKAKRDAIIRRIIQILTFQRND